METYNTLNLHSIFPSIDGEVNGMGQGSITLFIRLAGCNLNCKYCDTLFAQKTNQGKEISFNDIIEKINYFGLSKITITGGEPLLQEEALQDFFESILSSTLVKTITIETNGSIEPKYIFLVPLVYDYKLYSSGMTNEMLPVEFFSGLNLDDTIKFVIGDRDDYNQAIGIINQLEAQGGAAQIALSPVFGGIDPKKLISWMIQDKLDVIFNIQLHKVLNLKEPNIIKL